MPYRISCFLDSENFSSLTSCLIGGILLHLFVALSSSVKRNTVLPTSQDSCEDFFLKYVDAEAIVSI